MLEPENATHLKPWLVKILEPICDAEPGALADYILALLKHNTSEPELRQELAAQLDEFLEKECGPFTETLFTALRTKSYLPYAAPSPPPPAHSSQEPGRTDSGIPIPLDAIISSDSPTNIRRKRSFDQDALDSRPAKGPRLHTDGQFSRYGRQEGRDSWNQQKMERTGRMNIPGRADYMDGGMDVTNGRGTYRQQERRGICRDYHNNGYCARGAFCKYSHGDDAVIPSQLFPMNGAIPGAPIPFVPMVPNGGLVPFAMGPGPGAPYDPHERMDMRPVASGSMNAGPGRPGHPRIGTGPNGMPRRNHDLSVIQDLTPQPPLEERIRREESGDSYILSQGPGGNVGIDVEMSGNGPAMLPPATDVGGGSREHRRGSSPGGGGGGRSHTGRGTFGGDVPSFRPPDKRNDKTLVVEKIPKDKLGLGSVNEWFSRFGTVTNVAVDAANAKALVSFSAHDEALSAWKAEDAVFGNRFVKVFWHRPMEGHGQKGAKLLAASAPILANMTTTKDTPTPHPVPSGTQPDSAPSVAGATPRKTASTAASALAAKQALLQQQITEQKALMERLSTASLAEKKDIMARLRKLGEEMKAPPVSPSSAGQNGVVDSSLNKEQKEKERLDRELDTHHASGDGDGLEVEESTEELKAKLAKLKAEAASLGLDTSSDTQYVPSSYRPYRGRGRGGRSFHRGGLRGGPPRASMKLDNRPKKLLVMGAGKDALSTVRDWFQTTGQVDSVESTEGGDILVAFKTRAGAEQGLAKGANIATIGSVQLSWYNGQPSDKPASLTALGKGPAVSTSSASEKDLLEHSKTGAPHDEAIHDDLAHHEEEVVAGGWGGDDGDDGFGML